MYYKMVQHRMSNASFSALLSAGIETALLRRDLAKLQELQNQIAECAENEELKARRESA